MADLIIAKREDIVAIADAIRNKSGLTGGLSLTAIVAAINNISSSGENLDEELTQQDTLITNIMTALEGKGAGSSGSASMETCTVNIRDVNNSELWEVAHYTTVMNGAAHGAQITGIGGSYEQLIVLCGSRIVIEGWASDPSAIQESIMNAGLDSSFSYDDGSYGYVAFNAPETAGTTVYIDLY